MRIIPTILIGSLLAACTPAPDPTPAPEPAAVEATPPTPMPTPEPPMPGGYAPANLDDETTKAAQAIAVDAIYTRDPTRALVDKVEAEQQVVAGMNYRFVITMTGGAKFGVTVFSNLDGKMEVTDYAKLT